MLVVKNRLKKKREFNFVYKKGNVFYSKYFTMYVLKTKLPFSKVGFSVSNKIGNSVVRHKVKRKISEIVRININKMPVNNYVFVAKQGSENLDYKQTEESFIYLVQKFRDFFENEKNDKK